MVLVADYKIIANGTLEQCMYYSNSMAFTERKKYNDIWIQQENDILPFPTKIAILKQNGKEQQFSIATNKRG